MIEIDAYRELRVIFDHIMINLVGWQLWIIFFIFLGRKQVKIHSYKYIIKSIKAYDAYIVNNLLYLLS